MKNIEPKLISLFKEGYCTPQIARIARKIKEPSTTIHYNIKKLEKALGLKFGDKNNPLLVSVRSGAAVSMPGMMDTVLNLGINDDVVAGLAKKTGNERMAWDSYRRFINMFGDVCMGVDHEHYEAELSRIKKKYNRQLDTDLTAAELKEVVDAYKKVALTNLGLIDVSMLPNTDKYYELSFASAISLNVLGTAHLFGRIPDVTIYDNNNKKVLTNIEVDDVTYDVDVTFKTQQTGKLILT